jgi:DNA-binding NarL/FixJ family response regulator
MRCLIVDDEQPARSGMRDMLLQHDSVQVVGEASSVESALRIMEQRSPDLVFLDVQLRGETGFDFIERAPRPLPEIIFVTAYESFAVDAFRVNAVDYLLKPVEPSHLAEALSRVATRKREQVRTKEIAHPAMLQSLGLTSREAEVLFWIAHGKSNSEIAGILTNAPATVKKQVQSILVRLGVESRVAAAVIAAEKLGLRASGR